MSLVTVLECVVCTHVSLCRCLSRHFCRCCCLCHCVCVSLFCHRLLCVCHCSCFVAVSLCLTTRLPVLVSCCLLLCLSLHLLQCVFVTGFCGSVYVSDTLGLPISVSVCHRVCPSMCHHLPRCHPVSHCPGHRWACQAHWCQSLGPSHPTLREPGRAPVCNACPR